MEANRQYVFTSPSAMLALGKHEIKNNSTIVANPKDCNHLNDNCADVNHWNSLYESLERWGYADKDDAQLNEDKNSSSSSTQSTSTATPFLTSSPLSQVLSPLQTASVNKSPPHNPSTISHVHNKSPTNSSMLSLDTATGQPTGFNMNNLKLSSYQNQLHPHALPLPPQSTLPRTIQAILLFGGSAKYEVQTGGCSWLLLEKDTNMLIGQGAIPTRKPYPSIIQAECEGLLYGLQNAIDHNVHTINIKSSSEVVLQLISIRTIQLCPNRYLKTIYHYAESLFKAIQAHIDQFDRIVLELVPAALTKEVYLLAFEIMKNHQIQYHSEKNNQAIHNVMPPPLIIEEPYLSCSSNSATNSVNGINDDLNHFKYRQQIEHDYHTVPGVNYKRLPTNFDRSMNSPFTSVRPPQVIPPSPAYSNALPQKQQAYSSPYPYKYTQHQHQQQAQIPQRRASAQSTHSFSHQVPVDTALFANRQQQQLPSSRPVSPIHDDLDFPSELSPFSAVYTPTPQTLSRTATRTPSYTPTRTPTYSPPNTARSTGFQPGVGQDNLGHGHGLGLSQSVSQGQGYESIFQSERKVPDIQKNTSDYYSPLLSDINCQSRETLDSTYADPYSQMHALGDSQLYNYKQNHLKRYPWPRTVTVGVDTPTTVAANLTPNMTPTKPYSHDNEEYYCHAT